MAARPRLTVLEVVEALEAHDGPAVPDRDFAPLDELVSCILSQHSNDARTYPAFAEMKRAFPSWEALMAAPAEAIEEILKPAGLAKEKTRRMRAALADVFEREGAYAIDHLAALPDRDALAWLESLPGVGPKTAAVTLAFAFGRDVLPVDTHVYRVGKRLGWISEGVSEAKSHKVLAKKTPKGLARRAHLALIRHGRLRCHARNPACESCPLVARCLWAAKHQIGYHHSASATPTHRARMSQPVTAPTPVFDTARKQRCFAEYSFGHAVVRSVDRAPQSSDIWPQLEASGSAAERVAEVWLHAAALLPGLLEDPILSAHLLGAAPLAVEEPDRTASPAVVAQWAQRKLSSAALPPFDPVSAGAIMSDVLDSLVQMAVRRLSLSVQAVALGEWAMRAVGGSAPVRLLCFGLSSTVVEETALLRSWFDGLRRHGFNQLEIEPVAWTWEAFIKYELEHMPMRERYSLVSARSIAGEVEAAQRVRRVGFALPITPERLRELVVVRHRQETEEMRPSHRWRHVSLGYGSLADLLWIVQIHELRFPTATQAGSTVDGAERIKTLARAQLVNAVERDGLLEAWHHLHSVRLHLGWLGLTPEVVPENPAKLARLALAFGYDDANAFLAYHQRVVEFVRALVEESRERLRA
jgi:endonuclease-3